MYRNVLIFFLLFAFQLFSYERDEEVRQSVRHRTLDYFLQKGFSMKEPFPLFSPELYGEWNGHFRYSVYGPGFVSQAVILQPCVRLEDLNSPRKETLVLFHQLGIYNYKPLDQVITAVFDYLFQFCCADPKRIGIVSIKSDSEMTGFEFYIPLIESLGVEKTNVFLRETHEAFQEKRGDGYWQHPEFNEFAGPSYAIYYLVGDQPIGIENFRDSSAWIEIGEGAGTENKHMGISLGMERIENLFFAIPYPNKEELFKEVTALNSSLEVGIAQNKGSDFLK